MFYGDVCSTGGHCRSHLLTTIYGATNNAGMQALKLMAAGRTCLHAPSKVRHNGGRLLQLTNVFVLYSVIPHGAMGRR